jgi:hypothetical protein
MKRDKLAALVGTPLCSLVVVALVLAVGFGMAAVLGISDLLPQHVRAAMTSEAPAWDGLLVEDGYSGDAARGMQLGFLVLFFGGVPAAILAAVLSWRRETRTRRWDRNWAGVFLVGVVFQLSSLIVTGRARFRRTRIVVRRAAHRSGARRQHWIQYLGNALMAGAATDCAADARQG